VVGILQNTHPAMRVVLPFFACVGSGVTVYAQREQFAKFMSRINDSDVGDVNNCGRITYFGENLGPWVNRNC